VENLTVRQTVKLKALLACNLHTTRAHLLKEPLITALSRIAAKLI
jgi:hypothetical protein